MAEPTRAQIAQDYAKALAIIDDLRRDRDALLLALELVSCRRVAGELCWCDEQRLRPTHSAACLVARAALTNSTGRTMSG